MKMRDSEFNLMRRLEDRVVQNEQLGVRASENQRCRDIKQAAEILRKFWEETLEGRESEEDEIEYPTEQARDICERLVGEWEELYLKKNLGYGKVDSLGPKGVFPEINRKVGKLRRTLWEGEPDAPGSEPQREVILDMIGHLFIILHLLDTEGDPRDNDRIWFAGPDGVGIVGHTASFTTYKSPTPAMTGGAVQFAKIEDAERIEPFAEAGVSDSLVEADPPTVKPFHPKWGGKPTAPGPSVDAFAGEHLIPPNDEPAPDAEGKSGPHADCKGGICSGSPVEQHGGYEALPPEIKAVLQDFTAATGTASVTPQRQAAILRYIGEEETRAAREQEY